MSDNDHFYGGQAIIEGVMMRGTDAWVAAVRRRDGTVVLTRQPVSDFAEKHKWAKWPLVRGNIALVEALSLGIRSLIYSFNVLAEEEAESLGTDQEPKTQASSGWLVWLSIIPALALGIGLFVLLPAWVPDWLHAETMGPVGKNLIEAVARILAIIGYIAAVSLMPDVRRVFEYHGAEHATINCLEAGEPVRAQNCSKFSPLHPRCGTSFLLLFVVVKLLLNVPLGWPDLWLRLSLRLAMVLPAAAISYEILRYGGRRRDSWLGQLLAAPGKLLQRLTTRRPDQQQLETAIYALAALAEEVELPADVVAPKYANMDGKITDETHPTEIAGEEETV